MAKKSFARMTTKKKVRSIGAYRHNHRLIKNDKNVFQEHSHKNEVIKYSEKTYRQIELEFEKLYKEKHNRKAHSESMPLREIILLTNDNTTKEKIDLFVKEVEKLTGFKAIDVVIHKDEGHYEDGEFIANNHAQIMFESFDRETGKTIRPPLGTTEKLQDLASICLDMERGEKKSKTNKIHLTPEQYKQSKKQIEEEIKKYKKLKNLDNIVKNGLNETIAKLTKENELLKQENKELKHKNVNVEDLANLKKDNVFFAEKLDNLQDLFNALGLDNINVYSNNDNEEIEKKIREKVEEDYKKAREELKQSSVAKQADYQNLKTEKNKVLEVLSGLTSKTPEQTKQAPQMAQKAPIKSNKNIDIDY
jgi:hypothetical protein